MDAWLAAAEASPYAQSVDAFCRSAEALLHHDTADRLGARITVPTLVTVGELDLVLPERFSRRDRRADSTARASSSSQRPATSRSRSSPRTTTRFSRLLDVCS